MTGRRFEAVLSESLARLERGEPVDAVVATYPEFAAELRRTLDIRARLSAPPMASPPGARFRVEQAMRTALADRHPTAPGPSWRSLPSRAVVQLAVALITLTLGAASASAMVGTSAWPSSVTGAVDVLREAAASFWPDADSGRTSNGSTAPAAASPPASTPAATAERNDLRGLCTAFLAGGLAHHAEGRATAFDRLASAAGTARGYESDAAIDSFCLGLVGASVTTPTPGADGRGRSAGDTNGSASNPSEAGGATQPSPHIGKPDQSPTDGAPGNSGQAHADAPGQSGATPPGQQNEPGQQGTPPGQQNEPPGQQGTPPGQQNEPPGQQGTPPGQQPEPGNSAQSNSQTGANSADGDKGNDAAKGGGH